MKPRKNGFFRNISILSIITLIILVVLTFNVDTSDARRGGRSVSTSSWLIPKSTNELTNQSSDSSGSSSSSASLDDSSTEKEIQENQQDANIVVLLFLIMLTGAVLVVYITVSLKIPFIPESIVIVLYGIIIGVVVRNTNSDLVHHVVTFDPEKFFLFILPCIIFETGFSLPKTDFFKHFVPIVCFAVLGTLISFFITGGGIYLVGKLGWSLYLPAQDSFIFGAIISSTDPVATLAIFQALNVDPTLYMLVLGESILNDATAIMLYRTVSIFEPSKIWFYIIDFLLIALGSVGLGVAMAILLSLMLKYINIGRFPALETIFMIMFSYMSYVLANSLEISGILAVFFCGITFNQYGSYSLSPYTKLTSRQLFRTAAFICETSVFIYIGISSSFHSFSFHAGLLTWSIFFTCLSRAIAVFSICFVLNKFLKNKIELPIQAAIWVAGLRGAISFSLSLDYRSPYAHYILTDTLLIVIFTLFVFGIGTYPILKVLGIKTASSDQSLDNITRVMNKKSKAKEKTSLYQNCDEKYFKRWFRKQVPPLATEAVEIFEKLVNQSSEEQQQEAQILQKRKTGRVNTGDSSSNNLTTTVQIDSLSSESQNPSTGINMDDLSMHFNNNNNNNNNNNHMNHFDDDDDGFNDNVDPTSPLIQ
ncbi:Na-H exchanger [Cavenderia fasciculata]|uniref:Sodium/hydrogen exchanger n=1 Tax=Cavenderia fasciculata TaxID=261658 RepID=F4PK94_CACFS|nr:Na-H exchanger [Cavenderia fasciculata]EGG24018.1 Na-H exchanger [Cavenderia fasciculata]|eukprot:XP_004361869.1 Na-H exchanger [Cavenderia fasciculata]